MADNYLDDKTGNPVVLPVITDWVAYTPTIAGRTSNPTQGTGTTKAYWRRVGSDMEVEFSFTQTALGTAGSGDYLFPLPSGYTVNSTVLANTASASGYNVVGSGQVYSGVSSAVYTGFTQADGNSIILVVGTNGSSTGAVGSGFLAFSTNATMRYSFKATIPITEWAGSANVAYGAGLATSAKAGLVDYYDAGTHATNWSGPFASTAGNILYTRVGKSVTLTFPRVRAATGNSTSSVINMLTALPASLRPASQQFFSCFVADQGTDQTIMGQGVLTTAGAISINKSIASGTFNPTTAAVGFYELSISYVVA